MNPRNRSYKDKVMSAPYEICLERARHYTQSWKTTEGEHPTLRAAKAFAHTLRNMTQYILDEERIIGNRSSKLVAVVLPVERGDVNTIFDMELDLLTKRKQQPFKITDEEKWELRKEILPYWRGKTLRDRKKQLWKENGLRFRPAYGSPLMLRHLHSLERKSFTGEMRFPLSYYLALPKNLSELTYNNPAFAMNVFDVQGHMILGHKKILREGFIGVKERALKKLAELKGNDSDGSAFLQAVVLSCDAIKEFAERFADKAEECAAQAADPKRKQELIEAAERCRYVPFHPPRDFREAVQALWLTQVGALVAYGMVGIFAIGRIDQHLYPYFRKDMDEGKITEADAVDWLEELLIKLGYNLLLIPLLGKQTGSELGADSCAPTVGGVNAHGEDAVNELSYLTLDAFENVKSMGNSFTIRLSSKSPAEFWRKALATYRHTSGAALFNDDMAVKALKGCGYDDAGARDYGVIGCVEPTGDGDTFGCTSGNDISLVAALEMALLNGRLRIMGKRVGPTTGDPRDFVTFDQLLDAYKRQIAFLVQTVAKAVNLKDQAYQESFPNPYVSATLAGCVENARDMTAGGAKYNFASISGRGLGTAVDSLAAIRHFVYERREITIEQLIRMLNRNFGNDEVMQSKLANKGPKYGNDDDRADAIAADVVDFFCREVSRHQSIRGGPFRPGFFSYGMHVLDGIFVGATANGRRAGEPVSNSFSPSNGSEKKGPTAMLRSVAKVDHTPISNGCALNIKLTPSLFAGEEHLDKMVALIKGFFAQGGMEIQPNVVSTQTLKAAQANPDEYRDLVVRVSGYSAFFCDLGRPLQDEIISRTELGRLDT